MRFISIGAAVAVFILGGAAAAVSDIQASDSAVALPRVMVRVDSTVFGLSTSAETVGEVLDLLRITLGDLDQTSPAPDTPIADGSEIRITRVTCRDFEEIETMPSRTIVLADPDRPADFTKILCQGTDGALHRSWRVWEKDGAETSRVILEEEVVREPVDTVVLRGAHGAESTGDDWRQPLAMEATAYDPGPKSCGKWASGYTATGVKAEKGVVAVDDRVIPMGSRLYIPEYGFALAADRGSAIKGMRIDLCYPTYEEAIQFGRRDIKVYLLD
jgi:3D (Asp-Asp-Asp) domain-containing protein